MEGCGHQLSLPYQHGEALAVGEHFNIRANFDDAWRAYVDHLQRAAEQGSLLSEDRAIDLAAVGIALDRGIEDAEAGLGWMDNFFRQQNAASAGAKSGISLDEFLELTEKAVAFKKTEHGGRLAAGNDEAVEAAQLLGSADHHRLSPGVDQGPRMGGVVALNC